MEDAAEPLPVGSVLVHLGPYKTGTTAIQTSLGIHREDLGRHGVLYPGTHHRQFRPGWALLGRSPRGLTPVPMSAWEEMVEEVRSSDADRVCISTEDLASATPEHVSRLVADLGPDRVHVLMVVRRLDKLMPSAWQQRVKSSNEALSYDGWLRMVLADPPPNAGPGHTFWFNHSVANILERWSGSLPPERFVLLIADESDRNQQMRTFERLLGVPEESLAPGPRDNSSLTLERIEFYRRVNEIFDDRGWDDSVRRRLCNQGMLNGLRAAPVHEDEHAIPRLPRWAAERVSALSDQRVAEVTGSGALVLGDPERLRVPVDEHDQEFDDWPDTVQIETAAKAVEGLVVAALQLERSARQAGRREARKSVPKAPGVDAVSSRELLRVVARRQWGRVARRRG